MVRGSRCGLERCVLSVATFRDGDGGYTTVAVAVALLVTLALVFSAAAGEWALARSADVQEVADATALAGENCVAAFSTVVQVVDACVLSMGLTGLVVSAAGLVVSAVPGLQAHAPGILDVGKSILNARRDFSTTALQGLQHLERALPALIMANSASCVSANCTGGIEYFGCAVPFPEESQSDYSALTDTLEVNEVEDSAKRLAEATAQKERALERANEAKQRAWRADCVDDPMCMRSRAETLAGLNGAANPNYPLASEWRFSFACQRARNYYLTRASNEAPWSSDPEELSRSAARQAFYEYAYDAICNATCIETDEQTSLWLPELPHTSATVRDTSLYTDLRWPCTEIVVETGEGGGEGAVEDVGVVTLHSTLACPAAEGPCVCYASLAQLEEGGVERCDVCGMDVSVMGSVADASTNIDNGFEHYWRIVVQASRDYQEARDDARYAEARMQELAEDGASAFDQAIEALSLKRPSICPAGAWGCVSMVVRKQGSMVPAELTSSFISGSELPPGAALSAATLAPDSTSDGNTVLAHLLDGVRSRVPSPLDVLGRVTELWGTLLMGYGSSYENVSSATDRMVESIGSLLGEKAASWLRGKLGQIVDSIGLEPCDLSVRKPVLVFSQQVLDKAGLTTLGQARRIVSQLPQSAQEINAQAIVRILDELGYGTITIATLPIPGVEGGGIPLTIDLDTLVGAS